MDELRHRILQAVEEKKYCMIFKEDIEKICNVRFLVNPKMQKDIDDYAKANGLEAKIVDTGLRVIFRKKAPGKRNGAGSRKKEPAPRQANGGKQPKQHFRVAA